MKTIHFVTSNPGKVEILNNILKELNLNDIKIEMINYDSPEYKHDGKIETVALESAKHCASKFNKEIITTDVGLFIEALNEFPGINTAFTLDRIGTKGLIELMKDKENRNAKFKAALAYCAPNKEAKSFTIETDLIISKEEKGDKGFGFDPIAIPKGHNQTFAENTKLRDELIGYKQAFIKFIKWYQNV